MAKHPPLIATDALGSRLGDPRLVVLDASVQMRPDASGERFEFWSGLDAYAENGHIPGARFADLFTQFSDPTAPLPFTRPTAAQFAAAAGRLGITRDTEVVVYDTLANQWAARLWWVFRMFGHEKVSVLDGGLRKHMNEGRPIEHRLTPYAPVDYGTPSSRHIVASLDDVEAIVRGERQGQLICFLKEDDYAGTISVRARPGHIPGSSNLPFDQLVDETHNTLKPTAELEALFAARARLDGSLIVTYCGGGIASVLGALALAVLGYEPTMEYDGSLAEWSSRADLPLVVGPEAPRVAIAVSTSAGL